LINFSQIFLVDARRSSGVDGSRRRPSAAVDEGLLAQGVVSQAGTPDSSRLGDLAETSGLGG
jgi:hypothetical protein